MNYPKEWDELPKKERKKRIKKLKREQEWIAEQKRAKKNKLMFLAVSSLIVALFAYLIVMTVVKNTRTIEGLAEYDISDWKHVTTEVDYPQSPGVGGDHHPNWVSCNGDIYDEELEVERAIHALEHGAVWITYQKGEVSQEDIESLEKKVKNYTFMSPYSEQVSPIVLTAWGLQLELDDANDPRIDYFIDQFRQGPQTPEPGATCNINAFGM